MSHVHDSENHHDETECRISIEEETSVVRLCKQCNYGSLTTKGIYAGCAFSVFSFLVAWEKTTIHHILPFSLFQTFSF
jgi:hypothetical protein